MPKMDVRPGEKHIRGEYYCAKKADPTKYFDHNVRENHRRYVKEVAAVLSAELKQARLKHSFDECIVSRTRTSRTAKRELEFDSKENSNLVYGIFNRHLA